MYPYKNYEGIRMRVERGKSATVYVELTNPVHGGMDGTLDLRMEPGSRQGIETLGHNENVQRGVQIIHFWNVNKGYYFVGISFAESNANENSVRLSW